jgi:hypothetical protein
MTFKDFLELYRTSDICFDQLGEHGIGAIDGYTLWRGKSLIANVEPAILTGIGPLDNPVCSAKTSGQVCDGLAILEDIEFRKKITERSKEFVKAYMGASRASNLIFDLEPLDIEY